MGEKISCSNSDERDARKAHGFFSLFFFFFLTQSTRTYVFFHSINSHDRLRKEEGIAVSPTEAFSPAHKLKKKVKTQAVIQAQKATVCRYFAGFTKRQRQRMWCLISS